MKQLNKPSENMGGLLNIWAVPTTDYYLSGKTVTFSNTENIYQLYCSPDSLQFSETLKRTDAGIHYNTIVSGFAPKDSEELQTALQYIESRKWIVIFRDGNGYFKIAGNYGEALKLSSGLNTGRNTSDRAGCKIEFSGKLKNRAVFIDNPF